MNKVDNKVAVVTELRKSIRASIAVHWAAERAVSA